MRAEGPRSEPDIEWPGLAADIDRRSIVARSYRDIATAIFADRAAHTQVPPRDGSDCADHGEAAQGHQPTWLLPRAVRERMGTLLTAYTVTTKQCRRHRQPLSHHS